MPNLLDNIQTCQYDISIAVGDTIGKVKSVQNPRVDVDVIPVIEGGRKVHTAIDLVDIDSTTRSASLDGSMPVVGVAQASPIYGALETVNTSTQRCGVLTEGIVIFRKAGASLTEAIPVDGTASDIGRSVDVALPGPTMSTSQDNDGCVTSAAHGVGKGIILSYDGPYLLVDLSG